MSRRPRPHSIPVRPSLDDAEGPEFALLLTQTLRADIARAAPLGRRDMADRVVTILQRDPGLMGERMRFAADRHRRVRSAAGRVSAAVLVIALAVIAGRVEPARRGEPVAPSVPDAVERDLRRHGERWSEAVDAIGVLGGLGLDADADRISPRPTVDGTVVDGAGELEGIERPARTRRVRPDQLKLRWEQGAPGRAAGGSD